MKTDSLFYKLFKRYPGSFFRLVNLDIQGNYEFESITVKTTEKRFDGFLKDITGAGPNVFSEFQGWGDSKIYWRFFREVFTFYEQTDTDRPFVAVILFTDKKYDPQDCPIICKPPHRFVRLYLSDCLEKVGDRAGVLTVLKPLVFSGRADLPQAVTEWKQEIRSLELEEPERKDLEDLLIYAILQRFSRLSREEVEKMVELTPIEETVIGRELIQIGMERGEKKGEKRGEQKGRKEGRKEGRQEGEKRGMQKGKLIGEIRLARRLLKRPLISEKELSQMSLKKLRELFKELESDLYRD